MPSQVIFLQAKNKTMDLKWTGSGKSFLLEAFGNDEYRVKVEVFEGFVYVDIRKWFKKENAIFPTRQGVTLNADEFGQLNEYLKSLNEKSQPIWLNDYKNIQCVMKNGKLYIATSKRGKNAGVTLFPNAVKAIIKKLPNIVTIVRSEKSKLQ